MCLCVGIKDSVSLYDFSDGFWNCSDSMFLFSLFYSMRFHTNIQGSRGHCQMVVRYIYYVDLYNQCLSPLKL